MSPNKLENIKLHSPLFVGCKVSSFPENYYYKYKFGCKVLDSDVKELKNSEIIVISDYKPDFFSTVYILGKPKIKYGKLWLYSDKKFIKEKKFTFFQPFLTIREFLIKNFKESTLNYESFAIGNALIFGDRSYIPYDIKKAFIDTNLAHLLAISGLHIGVIILILLFIFSYFNKKVAYIITIVFLSVYVVITSFHIPVLRACFMGILYLYGKLKYLSINPLNILFFVAFISVFFSPDIIYSVGFQLSFLTVFGLIISSNLFKIEMKNNVLKFFITSILISFIATLWSAPIIIYHFGKFSPTSILATTIEIIILIPYLFLSILNMFSLFFIPYTVNFMDYFGG